MIPTRPLIAAALLSLVAADARAARPETAARPAPQRLASGPGVAVARDPGLGTPTMMWTPNAAAAPAWLSPEAAARLVLDRHRGTLRISRDVIAGARLRLVHDTGRGGIIVVLRPTVAGIDVFAGDLKVLLDRHNRPIAITGAAHPAAHPAAARSFKRSDAASVQVALADAGLADAPLHPVTGPQGWTYHALSRGRGPQLREPARARPVYFPVGEALVPAHFVELQVDTRGALEVLQYVIAADDGRQLMRRSATAQEAFKYRVWADADGDHRPADGPLEDYTPHPTGEPGLGPGAPVAPNLITMEGFNTNPDMTADPWLPAGAVETRGNNVDAYVDHDQPNGLDPADFRAKVTAPGTFDRTYDVTQEPLASTAQSMAAIVQLFYVTNWLHDDWYDAGFDEAAGNAQDDNFGRGGVDGDALRAEAQDAALTGARNNANMSTPADGAHPTMQMYLWNGLTNTVTLTVTPLAADFLVGSAQFGPSEYDLTAPLVVIEDEGGLSPGDGCEAPVNDLAGKIAVIDRGDCTFETKVTFAQNAGAVGVLIVDNTDGDGPLNPGNDAKLDDPTIPTQATSKVNGAAIKAALQDAPQSAHMFKETSTERDGTIDGMIIAHEWGHYIHHRLVECGSRLCGAESEGWGDFLALHTTLREGDDLHGTFGLGVYASFDPGGYFGIRRVPYSVEMSKNALSFRHIADGEPLPDSHPIDATNASNSESHNAGEVWTTMMWEAYVALHEAHAGDLEFAEVRRLMAEYVVAGMMLAPPSPTFLDQRDAILMAAAANSMADFTTIAEAFARRGAGSCAVSPPPNSVDFKGVVEDFSLGANGLILGATIADSVVSCDNDGVVDIGEQGRIALEVYNGGATPLPAGSTLEVVDPDPALVFPNGSMLTLPELAPLAKLPLAFEVEVAGLGDFRPLKLTLRLTTPDGCQATQERLLPGVAHADRESEVASSDDVEVAPSVWDVAGSFDAANVWQRAFGLEDGHYWHADDIGRESDTFLVSPPLQVAVDEAFVIEFDHAYSFETSDDTFWDGGVVEITRDGGKTWEDISTYAAATGYSGVIVSELNPIHMRSAYVGLSPDYPARHTETLNLTTKLSGETVAIRFRVGTDSAAGAPGWDIDNIRFTNITNTPFPRWKVDAGLCVDTGGESDESGESGATAASGEVDSASDSGPVPTEGGGGVTDSADNDDDSSSMDSIDSAGAVDDDGCGCTSTDRPRGLLGLLMPIVLLFTRRRSAAVAPARDITR